MTTFNLKAARLNKGLTVSQLADALDGVDEAAIYRLERGTRISPERAKKVADHFGVKVSDLPAFASDLASEAA
jgi:transcriptional regulator with XRE-family HTH domain